MKAATSIAEKRPRDAAYLRERANYALRSYYRDKLCASPSRCKAAKRQTQKLYGLIGYARLTLHFPQTPVAVLVTGFRYRTTKILKRSPWRLRLRPGNYDIALIGLGQQKKIASIKLGKSTKKSWRYQPKAAPRAPVVARRVVPPVPPVRPPARRFVKRRPPPRRAVVRRRIPPKRVVVTPKRRIPPRRVAVIKRRPPAPPPSAGIPTAATVAYIIGGVFVAGGAVAGIVAYVKYDEATRLYNAPDRTLKDAQDAESENFLATVASVIAIPTGLVIMGVGGILHAVLQKKPQPAPTNATIQPTQTSLLLKGNL